MKERPTTALRVFLAHRVRCPACERRLTREVVFGQAVEAHSIGRCECGQHYVAYLKTPLAHVAAVAPEQAERFESGLVPLTHILQELGIVEAA